MTRLAIVAVGLLTALSLSMTDARADKRVALVIGNGAYQNAGQLVATVRDANAVADLFRKAGFDLVEIKLDIGNLEFKRVARDFTEAARGADMAVVYFAGHGIEVNGTNYLLPVDAKLASDFDVEDEALSLDRVIRAVEPAKGSRLVILDASRANPFVRAMKRSVSAENARIGLAKVEPAAGVMIAFAAQPGATAEDRQGEQGAFTSALLKHLTGRDLPAALAQVRDEVVRVTASRQEPFVAGSPGAAVAALVADPGKPQAPSRQISVLPNPQAPAQFVADPQRDYETAERIGTREAWDAFLSVHPAGFYASLARAQRDKLVPLAAPAVSAPQPTQQVATLPAPNSPAQEITLDPRAIARELQVELKRVGCDPGATDGNWSPRSRDALGQFNRRAGLDLEIQGPTVDALEAVRVQRGRICPLVCGNGQRADGDRCIALPAAPKPAAKQAARPPERARTAEPPARRAPARETARRERPAPIRAPTDREIFGGGGRPAGPPVSIGIGGRGVGIGFGF